MLDEFIGPGLQLMEQKVELEDGQVLTLVVPRSSDAVMDYYINAGNAHEPSAYTPVATLFQLSQLLCRHDNSMRCYHLVLLCMQGDLTKIHTGVEHGPLLLHLGALC